MRYDSAMGLRDHTPPPEPNRPPWGLRVAAGAVVLYLAGFIAFMAAMPEPVPDGRVGRADGIVALTGEDARLVPAVALLEEGAAPRLLISGVYPGTTKSDLKTLT